MDMKSEKYEWPLLVSHAGHFIFQTYKKVMSFKISLNFKWNTLKTHKSSRKIWFEKIKLNFIFNITIWIALAQQHLQR